MAELKTKPNNASVDAFIDAIEDDQKRDDSRKILKMMQLATDAQPKMWGPSIIGFGDYQYTYASGTKGDWFLIGFSPRKQNLSLYFMSLAGRHTDLLEQLGKHKVGKGCLYIKRLSDIDEEVLEKMIRRSVDLLKRSQR